MRSYHDDTSDITFGSPTKFGKLGGNGGKMKIGRTNSMYRSKSISILRSPLISVHKQPIIERESDSDSIEKRDVVSDEESEFSEVIDDSDDKSDNSEEIAPKM